MSTTFRPASDLFAEWQKTFRSGELPPRYAVGEGDLAAVDVGPGRIMLLGGAPGEGKTALTMQMLVDALRLNSALRALVCNVEMSSASLFERQVARLSGVDLTTIRERQFDAETWQRLNVALATLEPLFERLAFVLPPYGVNEVAASAVAFQADLLLLDYVQRISPPGSHGDKRGSVDATMSYLRRFADQGLALLVVGAVARSRDSSGRSTYDGDTLSLASFRESSELEFGADDAYLLVRSKEGEGGDVTLRHLKARHSEPRDIHLRFVRSLQRFEPITSETQVIQLRALWPAAGRRGDDSKDPA